jgi:hypothetical protein
MEELRAIAETAIVGVAIASSWFYIRSVLSGDMTKRAVYQWLITIIPMGIAIAWGLKIIGVL